MYASENNAYLFIFNKRTIKSNLKIENNLNFIGGKPNNVPCKSQTGHPNIDYFVYRICNIRLSYT